MSPGSPSVFLVDDDDFQIVFLGGILRKAGHSVEAFDRPEVRLERLARSDRGCVVLDQEMPVLNGLELQRALHDRKVLLPLIFVSGRAGVPAAVTAMKQGALDFLSKPVNPAELVLAVETALRRDAEAAGDRAAREQAQARWTALTAREREVCRLFARGLLNKQIAAALGVTESTLQPQRIRALNKLQASTVADVVRLMAQAGDDGKT